MSLVRRFLVVVASTCALACLTLVAGGAGAQDDTEENEIDVEGGDVSDTESSDVNRSDRLETGRTLFETSCVSCHGERGEGTGQGPDIQDVGELGADFMLRTGRMPLAQPAPQAPEKPPAYTNEEIEALVTYVGSLGDGPPIPDVDIADADLVRGGELYRENCQPCHNASAIGGALSYGRHAPALTDVEPTQVVEAMRFGPGEMPVFGPDIFSDEEATDIARYVTYLHDPDDPGGFGLGHSGPTAEGFVAWLVGIGLAIWAVRWITSESGPARRPTPVEPVEDTTRAATTDHTGSTHSSPEARGSGA